MKNEFLFATEEELATIYFYLGSEKFKGGLLDQLEIWMSGGENYVRASTVIYWMSKIIEE